MDFLIKNANVVLKNSVKKKDILLKNKIIFEIADKIETKKYIAKTIDAKNLFCMPGIVDLHVHLREPGFEEKETIKTGSKAAAKGGITSLACMANTNPVIDCEKSLNILKEKIKAEKINIYPIAAITKNLEGKELVDFKALFNFGAFGFSDDGFFVENSNLMKKAIITANNLSLPIFSHCEDNFLSSKNPFNSDCESVAVARDIALFLETNCPLHICHVSTSQSINLIKAAKKIKKGLTAETCPHYFMLTKKERTYKNPNFKMNPPLQTEKDRLTIENAILQGVIDCIATDHAPHEEKSKEVFKTAKNGVIGLETSLACTLTHFYKTKKLTLPKISKLLSRNPAKILKLKNKGEIAIGNSADIILIDVFKEWTVKAENFLSKSKNSPFIERKLTGIVIYTFCNGKLIYKRS